MNRFDADATVARLLARYGAGGGDERGRMEVEMYLAIALLQKQVTGLQQSLEQCIEEAIDAEDFDRYRELQDIRTDLHNAAERIEHCNRPPGPERAPDFAPGRRRA